MDMTLILLLAAAFAAGDADSPSGRADGVRLIRSPAEDLESKIREGLAKKVDPARILEAVRQRRRSFRLMEAWLEKGFEESGRPAPEGEARFEAVLEMHRAMDLGLSRDRVVEILREALRARPGNPPEEGFLAAVFRFSGVAGGSGMPAGQVVRIVKAGVARGYAARDFRDSSRCLLDLRERLGSGYSPEEAGGWMEEGIARAADGRRMLEHVRARCEARFPRGPSSR